MQWIVPSVVLRWMVRVERGTLRSRRRILRRIVLERVGSRIRRP